jgi:mannose-1-phosphate guanylyltransferase
MSSMIDANAQNAQYGEPQDTPGMATERQEPQSLSGRAEANENQDFYAVIPAGGTGTRLWPLSREARPKFLYDLLGQGRTLIQSTYDRLERVAGRGHVTVSTGWRHVAAIREQLPQLDGNDIFAEPVPRDSTAAICLAAAVLARRHGERVVVGSFTADHVIRGAASFARAVREAVATARAGYVTTIGIAASRPSTALGYIHQGRSLAADVPEAPSARLVERFVEKPDAATA